MSDSDPSDHPNVKSVLNHLARHDGREEGAGPLPTPGRTLAIRDCMECPMSTVLARGGGNLACEADAYLAPVAMKARPIPPGPDGWKATPPDWCPLRAGPVTLEVKTRDI